MRFLLKKRLVRPKRAEVSGILDHKVNLCRYVFRLPDSSASTSLPPFAPRPLRRFITTMEALTSMRDSHPHRSPCLTHPTFQTIPSPTTPCAPIIALTRHTLSLSVIGISVAFQLSEAGLLPPRVQASPLMSRLADTLGRNGFVILRTGRSPPVALHPASRRRSYSRLQAVTYT